MMNRIICIVWGVVLVMCLARPASAQYGQIGDADTIVKAINDARDVVGSASGKPALWKWMGVTFALPPFDGNFPQGSANAINNFGDVVGSVSNGLSANVQKACLWQPKNGAYSSVQLIDDLSMSPVLSSQAFAINDAGWIVGSTFVSSNARHAFAFIPEQGSIDLTPNAAEAYAVSVNNRSTVVGYYRNASDAYFTPFVWTPSGGLKDLPRAGNLSGTPCQINDAGLIAGTVLTNDQPPITKACVWRPDRSLQVYTGVNGKSRFFGVNQEGMLAGTWDGDSRPLLLYFDKSANQFSVPLPAPAAPYQTVGVSQMVAMTPRSDFYNASMQQHNGAAIYTLPNGTYGGYPFVPDDRTGSRPFGSIYLIITPLESTVVGGNSITAEIRFVDGLTGDPISFVGDVVLRLSASRSGTVIIPSTVTIPDGSTSVMFTVQTLFEGRGYDVDIVATPPASIDAGSPSERTLRLHITHPVTTISGQVLPGDNLMYPTDFQFRNATGQVFLRTAILGSEGRFSFDDIPRGEYTIWAKKPKRLANTTMCYTTGGSVSGVMIDLPYVGDANGDNVVDIRDLLLLVAHYNHARPGQGYLNAVDFNEDGFNDLNDLLILIAHYNQHGVP